MSKQIIFSLLLIANTTIHGMESQHNITELNLYSPTIIPHITEQLCIDHNYEPQKIRKDIRALSETNTFFHDYYAQEKTAQKIIKICAYHNNSNDRDMARDLQCHAIKKEIARYINIAKNRDILFTEDDLKKTWYLTITLERDTHFCHNGQRNEPLLRTSLASSSLYMSKSFKNALLILDHVQPLIFQYGRVDTNLLCDIAWIRRVYTSWKNPPQEARHDLLIIAQQTLLKKNPVAHNKHKHYCYLGLIEAVRNNDKEMTYVLLKHGVDPYFTWKKYDSFQEEKGEPKGWFKDMVKEYESNKAILFYWFLKNYQPNIWPQELTQIIMDYVIKTTPSQNDEVAAQKNTQDNK